MKKEITNEDIYTKLGDILAEIGQVEHRLTAELTTQLADHHESLTAAISRVILTNEIEPVKRRLERLEAHLGLAPVPHAESPNPR